MHLHSFPVLFVAEADTGPCESLLGVSEMPVFHAAPGQWLQWLALCIAGNIVNSHWQTQARFGILTQGRIWEDMLDVCPITTQSLDSTFHALYRGRKPRLLWFRHPWLLPAANMSKGSYQSIYHLTQAFEGEAAKLQNSSLETESLSRFRTGPIVSCWRVLHHCCRWEEVCEPGLSTMRKWAARADGARGGIKACSFQEALPFEILVHLSSEPVSDS